MTDQIEAQLLTTPPRRISYNLLSEYTWSSNGTNDPEYDPDELRFFLPRYFHFIACGLFPNFGDWQPTLRQLAWHKYRETWPGHEIRAVDAFFDALVDHQVSRSVTWYLTEQGDERAWSDIDDVLGFIAHTGGRMEFALREWSASKSEFACLHLASLIEDSIANNNIVAAPFDPPSPFWKNTPEQAVQISNWLFRPETAAWLEKAISKTSISREERLLASARDLVSAHNHGL